MKRDRQKEKYKLLTSTDVKLFSFPGIRFALMQVKAGIAAVVSNFEIAPTDRTPIPIVLDPTNFLLSAKGGIWLKFTAING